MSNQDQTRRAMLRLAGAGAGAAVLIAAIGSASAEQGNMERAMVDLQSALRSLREATPDKGGHKAAAIDLIQQAMGEVQAGIDYAARKFGD
jgi:hypothetical protein